MKSKIWIRFLWDCRCDICMIRMCPSKFPFALKCLTTSIWLNFWLCNFCRQDRNFTHFCFRKVYLSTIARVPWLNKSMLTKYEKWSKADCYVSYHLNTIFVSLFDLGIFCIYSPRYILYLFTLVYSVFFHLSIYCIYSPRYIHDGGGKKGRKDVRKRSSWAVLHLGHR